MSKNRKITTKEFDYLTQLEPYIPQTNKEARKALKYTLLDTIESVFGDKWFNLRDKTRQAIEYICFLSIDRGFVYASPDHISTKYGIARSTVYEALKVLREEGLLFKANRSSRKQNGLGCSVHFFTMHPYFAHINSYLSLGWKANEKADRKPEKAQIPCGSKVEGSQNSPTLSLTTSLPQKMDIQSNVPANRAKSIVKYVPKEINQLYAGIFGFRLRFVWQKITQAWKTINQSILSRHDLIAIGSNVVKRIFQVWKDRMNHNNDMSIDEMCAYAYKTARETFYNTLANIHMQDQSIEEKSIQKSIQKLNKPTVKEPTSNVMKKIEMQKEDRLKQFEEAKRNIPLLEQTYLLKEPESSLEQIMKAVLSEIKSMYPLLDRVDISSIEQAYLKHTSQHHLIDDYNRIVNERVMAQIKSMKSKKSQQ